MYGLWLLYNQNWFIIKNSGFYYFLRQDHVLFQILHKFQNHRPKMIYRGTKIVIVILVAIKKLIILYHRSGLWINDDVNFEIRITKTHYKCLKKSVKKTKKKL